jgi:hypothetical protein
MERRKVRLKVKISPPMYRKGGFCPELIIMVQLIIIKQLVVRQDKGATGWTLRPQLWE